MSQLGKLDEKYHVNEDLYGLFDKINNSIRFLRVATPYNFRIDLIEHFERFVDFLIDKNISEIEFLLANPFGEPLLKKLDKEKKTNWQIWRIKNQILKFAKGILSVSEILKRCNISIGFHNNDLIWNLAILDDKKIILRSYGKGEKIGHGKESVQELIIESGQPSYLAESFINYYESIRSQPNTVWISSKKELKKFESENSWPTLFKGNAVRSSKRDLDKNENKNEQIKYVAKRCIMRKAGDSECRILNTENGRYFRVPDMSARITGEYDWRGEALEMEKINGPSIYEIFCLMNKDEENCCNGNTGVTMGHFVFHSLKALEEFRVKSKDVIVEFQIYPYSEKLVSALNEIRPFLGALSNLNWDNLVKDSNKLGKNLESKSYVSFRDAQMKNRLFKEKKNDNNLGHYQFHEFHEETSQRIYDIDFESAHYNVTRWDDIIHILLFENVGLISLDSNELELNNNLNNQYLNDTGEKVIKMIGRWTGLVCDEEKRVFWETVLLRSIREFCRRIWYANVMPNTYIHRYNDERHDYYLNLAILARSQIGGTRFRNIQMFLKFCRDNDKRLWSKIKEDFKEKKSHVYTDYIKPEPPKYLLGNVLILGKHTKDDEYSKLSLIKNKLNELGYNAKCVIEEPDKQGETFIKKALRLARDSKFVIIENTEPGGQLYEIAHLELDNFITVILQERNKGSSWIVDGIEKRNDNFEKFEYEDESNIQESINEGVKWAEQFIFEQSLFE